MDDEDKAYLLASYITQRRIYDVMARILAIMDEDEANALISIHERGAFITPPPSIMRPDDRPGDDDTESYDSD